LKDIKSRNTRKPSSMYGLSLFPNIEGDEN